MTDPIPNSELQDESPAADEAAGVTADATAPNVVSVAATDNRDYLASFSNYGQGSVHLGAPGVNVAPVTVIAAA